MNQAKISINTQNANSKQINASIHASNFTVPIHLLCVVVTVWITWRENMHKGPGRDLNQQLAHAVCHHLY